MNRPLILVESLQNEDRDFQHENKVDHLFRLEFDPCVGISPTWVDTKTLNFFNKLRDNIFASSGQYDTVLAVSQPEKPKTAEAPKKNRFRDAIEEEIKKDKTSVAFQRGKRSCTLQDMKEKLAVHSQNGKKSVGSSLVQ